MATQPQRPDSEASHYQGLAIYRAATLVFVCCDKVVKHFSRHHTYMLGNELRQHAMRAPVLVMRANRRAQRVAALDELCLCAETMKILVNLGKEVEAFVSFAAYVELTKLVVDLAKQAEAWRRYSVQARPVSGPHLATANSVKDSGPANSEGPE